MKTLSQKTLWDKNWEADTDMEKLISSRFTSEAYRLLSSSVTLKDRHMLEAGCGTGRLSNLLAREFGRSEVIGIDISENSIRMSNRLKNHLGLSNASFVLCDMFNMPFRDDSFDFVFNEGVIEHYGLEGSPTYEDALKEMIRVAKRGGTILAGVPNWFNFPHTLYKWMLKKRNKSFKYDYEKSFRHSELAEVFLKLGLGNIRIGAFYPAHGFYRLSGPENGRYNLMGRLTDNLQKLIDRHFDDYFSYRFGFEIMVKGEKA